MRGMRFFVALVFVVSQFLVVPIASANDTGETELVSARPAITEVQIADGDEFVELHNPSDEPLSLAGMLLKYRGGGASYATLADLNAIIMEPRQFLVFGHFTKPIENVISFSTALNNTKGEVLIIDSMDLDAVLDVVAWGNITLESGYHFYVKPSDIPPVGNSLQRCFFEGELRRPEPVDTSLDFLIYENDLSTPFAGIDCLIPVPVEPVTDCSGVIINEIGANLSSQFVEVYNPTDEALPLAGCKLQTNRSSKTYTFIQESIPPGTYVTVFIEDTELTLTKTTTGTVYFLTSDGLVETDVMEYSELDADTSWARFETGWYQTYSLTPGEENIDEAYPPCDDGYFRNLETGRCNLVQVDILTPCSIGQYRSLETNRCRNILTQALLKPCSEGQYRNQETNRCRKVSATSSSLKPCASNQYRSPETNRCRKKEVGSVPNAAYKVQSVADDDMVFAGWWALGGVGALAGSYAGWEWRRELMNLRSRLIRLFSR